MEDASNNANIWQLREKVVELEASLADRAQQHGQEISDLQSRFAKLQSQLEHSEALRLNAEYQLAVSQQEITRLKETVAEKSSELQSHKSASQDMISKLSEQYQEWQHTMEVVQKAWELERAKNHEILTTKEQEMASHFHDYEELQRSAAKMTSDLFEQQRLRSLEEQLVIERTLSQDHKSSNEALQCQLKEAQGTLTETQGDLRLESLARQQAEEALRQSKGRTCVREELQRVEHDHTLKMREKDSTMEDLSYQLQLCKSSLSSLKQEASELAQAKQRQSHVAEHYGSFVNQLREEVHVFCMKTLKQSGPFPIVPSPPPEEVLKALKEKKNHLTLECAKCQDSLKSNTLAKEELETRLHQMTRELSRSRSELTKATSQVCEQRASLERMKVTLDRRGSMLTKIREEHAALKKQDGCRQQVFCLGQANVVRLIEALLIHSTCPPPQAYFKFLDALHGVLQGAKTTHPAAVFSPHLSKDQEEHQWSRLTSDVLSMARSVGKELKTSREELAQVRTSLEKEKMTVLATQLAHKDLEAKLLRQLEDQEVTWKQRLQLVSSEYAPALSNLTKKMERQELTTCDALQHVHELLSDNQSLLQSLEQSQAVHRSCASRLSCLLAAVTLLSGALLPSLHRIHALTVQRQLLSRQLASLHVLRDRATHLRTSVLAKCGPGKDNPDNGDSRPLEMCHCHVLLKFRKVAIVVLAANRLALLGRENRVTCVVPGDGTTDGSVAVHIREPLSGGVKLGTQGHEVDHLQWLQSEGVLTEVCKSLRELQSLLSTSLPVSGVSHHDNNQTSRLHHLDNTALVVKFAFCHLLQGLLSLFEPKAASPVVRGPPLCGLLERGLTSVLTKKGSDSCCLHGYITCLKLANSMDIFITDLVGQLQESKSNLREVQERLCQRDKECETLAKMVSREEYEVVCREKDDVIKSRETLNVTVASFSKDLHQIQTRCEYLNRTVKSRDLALTEAAKDLNDLRMALKHRDHQVKLLEVQLHSCENERQVRMGQLEEMMEAVQKLTSEKELTYQIMVSAEEAFRKIAQAIESFAQERVMTNPGISRCELTLKVFVEAHQCALSCMAMLNERLASSKAHIEALKGELSAACLRQCDE
eukprot:Em0011g975a